MISGRRASVDPCRRAVWICRPHQIAGHYMLRFTIRDLLTLTTIAGVACGAGMVFWRADSGEARSGDFYLFVFGAACFLIGLQVVLIWFDRPPARW